MVCQTKEFLPCIRDTNKIISKTLTKITSREGIAKVISAGVGHRVDTTTLILLLFGPMMNMAIRGTSSFQIHGKNRKNENFSERSILGIERNYFRVERFKMIWKSFNISV
jgi:hypothetical protein